MTNAQNDQLTLRKPLRVWPGVVIVILHLALRFVLPVIKPDAAYIGVFAGVIGSLLILIWWLFFSRALWVDRIGAVVLMILAVFATRYVIHESIRTGAMGMLFYMMVIPLLSVALVAWAVVTRHLSIRVRRVTMIATILLACGFWTLIRTGGFTGEFKQDLAWRWSKTPEERLIAQEKEEPAERITPPAPSKSQEQQPAPKSAEKPLPPLVKPKEVVTPQAPVQPAAPAEMEMKPEWPGFRGPERNGIIRGVRIETDWTSSPPVELWRRPIGPGWSSFAVAGDLIYTQEQRGDNEEVSCYNKNTGKPVWRHRDATRFWESNAGPGPRGTPTLDRGRVYAFGATGIMNALNAADGTVVWSRNAASDTSSKTPGWGFASSPLVLDDVVIVAVAGQLAAYDVNTGKPRWFGPKGGTDHYSSPHLVTIDGITQILLMCKPGATSFAPATGKLLWTHPLPAAARIVQPAVASESDILIAEGEGHGLRRIAVTHGSKGWSSEERWTSIGLKPYFNDFVIHNGHAFGFDGSFLSCIDIQDGKRIWKGGHYGAGQLILLADQDLLLVVSEKGELALVRATSDQFTELAHFPAIKSKTWNHPVLVGDILLVRNGEEMAAFRLSLAHD